MQLRSWIPKRSCKWYKWNCSMQLVFILFVEIQVVMSFFCKLLEVYQTKLNLLRNKKSLSVVSNTRHSYYLGGYLMMSTMCLFWIIRTGLVYLISGIEPWTSTTVDFRSLPTLSVITTITWKKWYYNLISTNCIICPWRLSFTYEGVSESVDGVHYPLSVRIHFPSFLNTLLK